MVYKVYPEHFTVFHLLIISWYRSSPIWFLLTRSASPELISAQCFTFPNLSRLLSQMNKYWAITFSCFLIVLGERIPFINLISSSHFQLISLEIFKHFRPLYLPSSRHYFTVGNFWYYFYNPRIGLRLFISKRMIVPWSKRTKYSRQLLLPPISTGFCTFQVFKAFGTFIISNCVTCCVKYITLGRILCSAFSPSNAP